MGRRGGPGTAPHKLPTAHRTRLAPASCCRLPTSNSPFPGVQRPDIGGSPNQAPLGPWTSSAAPVAVDGAAHEPARDPWRVLAAVGAAANHGNRGIPNRPISGLTGTAPRVASP